MITKGVSIGGPASGQPARSMPANPQLSAALQALAEHPQIAQANDAVREATTELRWQEALRKRWREARAETSIRSAVASGAIEGAVIPAEVLRSKVVGEELTRATTGDPALDAVAGLWRAHARLETFMSPLVGRGSPAAPSARALLAGLHRDVTGPLTVSGVLPESGVGSPRDEQSQPLEGGPGAAPTGEDFRARFAGLLELLDCAGVPGLVRAAVVHGELVTLRPFLAGNAAVGRLLLRHLLVRDGVEPTGVAVLEAYAAQAPQAYREAAAAYASGEPDGVAAWVVWHGEAVVAGCREASQVCRAVQAGSFRMALH